MGGLQRSALGGDVGGDAGEPVIDGEEAGAEDEAIGGEVGAGEGEVVFVDLALDDGPVDDGYEGCSVAFALKTWMWAGMWSLGSMRTSTSLAMVAMRGMI